jgi:deoxyribonuclease V
VRWVVGLDVHYPAPGEARAAAVCCAFPGLEPVEARVVTTPVSFPYVPGLLSFREAPPLLEALAALEHHPDLLLIDGHGIAHPRRFGVASHLGVLLDVPAIGCAKSRLCGRALDPGLRRGDWTPLVDGDEVIGAVLRTRDAVRPLYVSTGHRVDLAAAIAWVLACGGGYRLPEPCRLAHRAAGGRG